MSAPIDYSRCPMWWWFVVYPPLVGVRFVRAADYEAAMGKARALVCDVAGRSFVNCTVKVSPQMERSGPPRQCFAGYGDE